MFFLFVCQAKLKKGEDNGHGKSYNSWLAWWRSTITTDDFLKFLSTQVRDFQKSLWSCLFRSLRLLSYSTLTLLRSTCGRSTHVMLHLDPVFPLQCHICNFLAYSYRPRTLFCPCRFFIHALSASLHCIEHIKSVECSVHMAKMFAIDCEKL